MTRFVSAIRTTARGVLGLSKSALDLEPVSEAVLQDRRKACAACPAATRTKRLGVASSASRLQVLTPMSTCSVCKCNLHAKTRLAGETCPRKLW